MKRWIHSATAVKTYRNKRNPNKYLEVHEDGYGHRSAKQYMEWKENGVNNPTGDGNLHRWHKDNIDELLEDYEEVTSSYDPTEADTYVVKIWHEIEPSYDAPNGPEAAEEIFTVVATSPQEAKEYAMKQWKGPIDRIEIVDINPEENEDYIPFDSCDNVTGSDMLDHMDQFDAWYDSLSEADQARVDDLADDMGLPLYEECDEVQLAQLHDCFVSNVKSSTEVKASEVMRSGASIDFAWKDDYDSNAIEKAIINAFEDAGAEVTGIDFYSVDYSNYPEYADKETSQVGVDFTWYDNADYNADAIKSSIEEEFASLGYQFLGIDFYSQMD